MNLWDEWLYKTKWIEGSHIRNYQGVPDQAQEGSLSMCVCANHAADTVDAQWGAVDWLEGSKVQVKAA